jgi:hypothetical protein
MATVGGSIVHGRGGITIGAPAVWSGDGELADSITSPPLARSTAQPANPTGNATATATMMGLAGSVTPKSNGNVLAIFNGTVFNPTAIGDGVTIQISYGTGSAPANAATLTGTQVGTVQRYIASTTAGKSPFCLVAYVTGLVAGTAYWLDLAVADSIGGTATITDVNIVAIEI